MCVFQSADTKKNVRSWTVILFWKLSLRNISHEEYSVIIYGTLARSEYVIGLVWFIFFAA